MVFPLSAAFFLSSAVPSPGSVSAPVPGVVADLALGAGASFLCVRPSARSFSRWCCVVVFRRGFAARSFARSVAGRFGLPFCAVRVCGSRFAVSVPCFVASFSSPAASLPCLWLSLGGGGGGSPVSAPVPPSPPVPPVPAPVAAAVSSASSVGFSGSRSVVPPVLGSVLSLVAASSVLTLVGCARGVDEAVRSGLPASQLHVFRATAFGSGRPAFARRSTAFVRALAAAGGVLFSFPTGACPVGLRPSPRWASASGSGSWGTLSVAVGLGVPCFVFLGSVPAPRGWGLVSLGGGWWRSSPAPVQLSLF